MDVEFIKTHIANGLDLLQVITEDMEENLMPLAKNSFTSNHVSMAISSLYVLHTFLSGICKETRACPYGALFHIALQGVSHIQIVPVKHEEIAQLAAPYLPKGLLPRGLHVA